MNVLHALLTSRPICRLFGLWSESAMWLKQHYVCARHLSGAPIIPQCHLETKGKQTPCPTISPLMEIFAAATALFTILFFTSAYKVINWIWFKPRKLERRLRSQGLKVNPYRVLYGDMKDNMKMIKDAKSKPIGFTDNLVPRLLPFIHHCLATHGKNSVMWLGPRPRVLLMEPELIKEVFNKIHQFHKPRVNPLLRLLAAGVSSYDDEKWVKHRKLINPAFHSEKIKNMLPAFYQISAEMVNNWEKLDFVNGTCEFDVWPDLQNMTRDVISKTAFGSSYLEGKRIFDLQRELSILVMQVALRVYIPGWRFVPTKMNRKMKALSEDIEASIRTIIDKKERAMKEGKAASDDLLGLLIESNMKETKEHKNDMTYGMTLKEVIEECKLFYFAGQETTSVLLVWTMILLSQHQEWQERARNEVLQVFGLEKPNFDGLQHLKIVNMILHEVLRLYPPIAALDRAVIKQTKLGDLSLPAGVLVSLPILPIQRDPELWGEDANEFKPERFSEGVYTFTVHSHHSSTRARRAFDSTQTIGCESSAFSMLIGNKSGCFSDFRITNCSLFCHCVSVSSFQHVAILEGPAATDSNQ